MLDAEVRIGELMAATPKAANQYARDSGVTRKTDALKQAGFTGSDEKIRQMAHRFETLAAHPEIVAQAKAEGQLQRRCKEKTKARTPRNRIRANAPLQWNNATTNSR